MSLLSGLKKDPNTAEGERDVVGAKFEVPTGVYNMNIDVAFEGKSSGGATQIMLHLKGDGAFLRIPIIVTTTKGATTSTKDGVTRDIPGFTMGNTLCQLVTGKPLAETAESIETKIIKLYDWKAGKEVDTKVPMIMDLVNQPVTLGIQRVVRNKMQKLEDGSWQVDPSGAITAKNRIDKIFRASDGLSLTEIRAEATESVFKAKWAEDNITDVNEVEAVPGVTMPTTPAPAATPAGAPAPTKSLFGAQ
jgi:hypothetical protein